MGPLGYMESEEDRILDRLRRFAKIHVARPQGQQAVMDLKRAGRVNYHLENGIMVVYLPGAVFRMPPAGGGGSAA